MSLVTVAKFTYVEEAHVAKCYLESFDIPCFVADTYLIGMKWILSNAIGGIRLQVPSGFEAQAKKVFENYGLDNLESDDISLVCPSCESNNVVPHTQNKFIAFLLLFYCQIPFWFRKGYKCKDCRKFISSK